MTKSISNPPKNKWLPVSAVKFNQNGSVSMMGARIGNPSFSLPKRKRTPYKRLCPICGQRITIVGTTKDGRAIGSCGDAFKKTKNVGKRKKRNPSKVTKTYDLYWPPEGRKIATVQATSVKSARSKAPLPYRKYKGEIEVEIRGHNRLWGDP
jgi:hypothetical protein